MIFINYKRGPLKDLQLYIPISTDRDVSSLGQDTTSCLVHTTGSHREGEIAFRALK